VSTLAIGPQSIDAVYSSDANFLASTSTGITVNVGLASSSVSVSSSNLSVTYGQSITFTATVSAVAPGSGTATGTVDFYDGPNVIGTETLSGTPARASLSVSGFDAGTASISASYEGDTNFVGSTSTAINQVIVAASTSLSLTTSGISTVFGEPETFTATATTLYPGVGTPTGTVDFQAGTTLIGSAQLVDGVAILDSSTVPSGSQAITATLEPSTNFLGSTSPQVDQLVSESSTLTVLSGANQGVDGQSLTFTATVTPIAPATGVPSGFILFEDDFYPIGTETLDANGMATITVPISGVGSHSISAIYASNGDYGFSESAPISAMITPSLNGTVYLDLAQGSAPNASTTGVAGQSVFLDLNGSGTFSPNDPTALTDANGNFSFPGYAPGAANVFEEPIQSTTDHYAVVEETTAADGTVSIGVLPISSIAPVPLVDNSPTSTVPASQANLAYVNALYEAVLGQAGSGKEFDKLVSELNKGKSRLAVAKAVINSPAHRQAEVNAYYQTFLHQAADGRAQKFVHKLIAGAPEAKVVESILDSPPFRAQNQDPSVFASDLYIDVLGANGTAAEISSLALQLSARSKRRSVVEQFVQSAAVDIQIVDTYYSTYLHQLPNASDLSAMTQLLDRTHGSASKVAEQILASDEFYQQSQGNSGQ
jgi:hypothetical protein